MDQSNYLANQKQGAVNKNDLTISSKGGFTLGVKLMLSQC